MEVFWLYVLFLSFINQTNNKNLIIIQINYSTKISYRPISRIFQGSY